MLPKCRPKRLPQMSLSEKLKNANRTNSKRFFVVFRVPLGPETDPKFINMRAKRVPKTRSEEIQKMTSNRPPKGSRKRSKNDPWGPVGAFLGRFLGHLALKRAQRDYQEGPRGPKRPPKKAPRGPQEAPRRSQEGLGSRQEGSRRAFPLLIDRSAHRDGKISESTTNNSSSSSRRSSSRISRSRMKKTTESNY